MPGGEIDTRVVGEGAAIKRPVASRTLVVYDPALEIHRQIQGGQRVPADLVRAYEARLAEESEKPGAKADGPAAKPSRSHTKKPEPTVATAEPAPDAGE